MRCFRIEKRTKNEIKTIFRKRVTAKKNKENNKRNRNQIFDIKVAVVYIMCVF